MQTLTRHDLTEQPQRLFDEEQISLGLAARLAGLSCGEMTDELPRGGIAVTRTTAEVLQAELCRF